MDSFEINKIVAVLLVALIIIGINKLSNLIFMLKNLKCLVMRRSESSSDITFIN